MKVEIVLDEGEDGLELGESCGQAKLRGRAVMPSCEDPEGVVGVESALDRACASQQGTSGKNNGRILRINNKD